MRQRFFVLLLVSGLVAVLVLLNALTYVQTQKEGDSELHPNRSTYNPGATGTQAFYTLLSETGRKPVRWQDSPDGLATAKNKPDVLVMIGSLRRELIDGEAASLLRWISGGGRLVIIDRDPPKELCISTAKWKIAVSSDPAVELLSVDPSDQHSMTSGTAASKPVQPTLFTARINAVQPSRFAGWVSFERSSENDTLMGGSDQAPPPSRRRLFQENGKTTPDEMPSSSETRDDADRPSASAPVVHIAGDQKNLLVDVPYGSGSIVYLTDPYIVSNSGINIVDNGQLAMNIVASPGGTIAFDEYHQGYGSNANRLFQYFEGTPVVAIFIQCALLIGLIFFSQSRRFARPLPENEPDRLSKLEYVTAMAELQQRTRAYDLAMENIYTDFRRRVARAVGVDNLTTTRRDIALSIAERTAMNAFAVNELMSKCEAIIQGEPTNKTETVDLTVQLREIEEKLGIERTPRGKSGR